MSKITIICTVFIYYHIYTFIYLFSYFVGVIVFGSDQEVAELMKAVKRMNATGQFSWIGSDGWSARALVSDGKHNYSVYSYVTKFSLLHFN